MGDQRRVVWPVLGEAEREHPLADPHRGEAAEQTRHAGLVAGQDGIGAEVDALVHVPVAVHRRDR